MVAVWIPLLDTLPHGRSMVLEKFEAIPLGNIDMLIRTSYLAVVIFIALLCSATFAGLISCPDCGAQVSDRAVMCPACGCPGEAILVAVQSKQMNRVELPFFCHSLVRVTSDQNVGVGVCIEDSERLYVLTAQNLLAGAQSLVLEKILDSQPIAYTSIELASDRNLVRLAVNATNLQPLAIAEASNADLALVYVATNQSVLIVQTGAVSGSLPIGSPLLDAATNLVMVVESPEGKHAEIVATVPVWVSVKPMAYRIQSTLLQVAAKQADPEIQKQLQETEWLTPYLAQQAEMLVKELEQNRSDP